MIQRKCFNGKYQCPCCSYYTLSERPGSYEICPVCYWEDDRSQEKDPEFSGGANTFSLKESQENFKKFAASDPKYIEYVRVALPEEIDYTDSWRKGTL